MVGTVSACASLSAVTDPVLVDLHAPLCTGIIVLFTHRLTDTMTPSCQVSGRPVLGAVAIVSACLLRPRRHHNEYVFLNLNVKKGEE